MRAVEYLSTPADPEFVHHMIDEVGLSDRDRRIVWSFRLHPGMEMDYYADLAQIPRKKFTGICGWIFRRIMTELIRLAYIGWQAERKK